MNIYYMRELYQVHPEVKAFCESQAERIRELEAQVSALSAGADYIRAHYGNRAASEMDKVIAAAETPAPQFTERTEWRVLYEERIGRYDATWNSCETSPFSFLDEAERFARIRGKEIFGLSGNEKANRNVRIERRTVRVTESPWEVVEP